MKSIVHPYRKPPPLDGRSASVPAEELIFYLGLCAVGAIPVAILLVRGGVFGVEPTIGLMMMLAGITGLFAAWRVARQRRTT